MKIRFIFITVFLLSKLFISSIFSQEHFADQWIIGRGGIEDSLDLLGLSYLNFQSSTLSTGRLDTGFLKIHLSSSSISDEEGELLFYTNGFSIANAAHELMENGDSLTPGNFISPLGMNHSQGVVILPFPEHPNKYVVFHSSWQSYSSPGVFFGAGGALYYSIVNMTENNGLGNVTAKNIAAIIDTLAVGTLTANRHANGRDWWILLPEFQSNKMYRFLLTPEGVIEQAPQFMDENFRSYPTGQAVFSPDGTKYARAIPFLNTTGNATMAELSIFDFDRCTGLLSNKISNIRYGGQPVNGVSISPNSRFLYHLSPDLILQYDLWEEDIFASEEVVATYDGYGEEIPGYGFFPALFLAAQVAPDGKIYICSTSSVKAMHVIHNPNEKGEDCNVEQHAFLLPTLNSFSVPYHPNYTLGAMEGSACDTLTVAINNIRLSKNYIKLWPNPSMGQVFLTLSEESHSLINGDEITVSFINELGRVISRRGINTSSTQLNYEINLPTYPTGIYFWEAHYKDILIGRGKLLLQKK